MRLDPGHVPALLRRAGVVGAGGAGFPAYVKYQKPTRIYIANCTESEPGYYGDKLLMRDHADVICKALKLLRDVFHYERVVLAVKRKHIHYCTEVIHYAEDTGHFEMAYVPDQYMMGEEKALTRQITGEKVPHGAIPPHIGVTVQNTETLYNIYWALTEHRPVTNKFLQTIGEIAHDEVIRAPIGTSIRRIWTHAGEDADKVIAKYKLVDGGPLLGDVIEDHGGHVVTKTTNGLFAVDPEKFKGRGKMYPGPGHEPPSRIAVIVDEVDHVEVPLGGRYGEPAVPVVNVGEEVRAGQEIGHYVPDKLSVSVHASIPGKVTKITDTRIHIERQA
jgi:Na+-translocating ferredoxin:NAD+ oxidoreductase RnfC subunit